MSGWMVVGAFIVVPLLLMYVSARGFACNVKRLRHAWRTPPLHGLDVSAATVVPVPVPRNWPAFEEVTAAEAAAYASLAENRMLLSEVVSNLLTVVGGAALGVYLPLMFKGGLAPWPAIVAVVVAFVGIIVRTHATQIWAPVSARYRARHAALSAPPPSPPAPAPPPRRLSHRILGVLRRR